MVLGGIAAGLMLGGATFVAAQQGGESAPQSAPAAPNDEPPQQGAGAAGNSRTAPAIATDEAAPEAAPSGAAPAPAPAKLIIPLKRPRYATAVIQALDKVTAETMRFEAPVGRPVRYKSLVFTVHACETTAPDEQGSDAMAHVDVESQPRAPDGRATAPARDVFKGWMFAGAPGLNLIQHPVYDAWLIACKTVSPSA